MRAFLLFVALGGCGFHGAPGGGDQPIDAAASSDGSLVDAPPNTVDAPLQPDASPDAPPLPNSCGAGYATVAGAGTSTYRRVNTPATWDTATVDCADDGNGAHLVIPKDKAEALLIYNFVEPDSGSPYFRAGIEDMNDDGTWTTVLGTTYANPPWAPSEPDDDDCVLIGSTGAFYDYSCNALQEYACECPE